MDLAGDLLAFSANEFFGGGQQGNVGGQLSHVQLFNPGASAVNLFLRSIWVMGNAGGDIILRTNTAALATNVTTLGNKQLGGAAPSAEIRRTTNAAAQGTALDEGIRVQANVIERFMFETPFVVVQGRGFIVQHAPVNTVLAVWFEWAEKV